MEVGEFKRCVWSTQSPRTVKMSIRRATMQRTATQVLYGLMGISTETGGLMQVLSPFLAGNQLTPEIHQNAFEAFGGVMYYTILLSRYVHVKTPVGKKPFPLRGMTKTEAVFRLSNIAADMQYMAMGAFLGTPIKQTEVAEALTQFIAILWPLACDLLGLSIQDILDDYIARISPAYPDGIFSDDKNTRKAAIAKFRTLEKEVLYHIKSQESYEQFQAETVCK